MADLDLIKFNAHGKPRKSFHRREGMSDIEILAYIKSQCAEDASKCHIWTRSKDTHGYGSILHKGRVFILPRLVWILTWGPIPSGMLVLHSCNTPACCNPGHLWTGTSADNVRDREKKGRGRQRKGEGQHKAKLKDCDIISIRQRYAAGGVLQADLGRSFGVGQNTISRVILRQTWKHVT